jgi:hypothetical protein
MHGSHAGDNRSSGAGGPESPNVRLLPQHLADLRRSGLSDAQIARCGFHSLTDAEHVRQVLRWKRYDGRLGPCLALPFCDHDGRPTSYVRVKPDAPRGEEGGGIVKYESPKGMANRPYFPPGTLPALQDPSRPLLVTEGEKKAAKADQEGFPCVGLVGVYGWQKKRARGPDGQAQGARELTDALAAVTWRGRTVYLAYDSDAASNANVRWAEWHLAQVLVQHGATVKIVRLPPGAPGPDGTPAKVGLDDYLVAHTAVDFRGLLAEATDPDPPGRGPKRKKGKSAEEKESHAAALLRLAGVAELFHAPDGTAYATVPVEREGGAVHHETVGVRRGGFRKWLLRAFYHAKGQAPSSEALHGALGVLEARAVFDGVERPVFTRVGSEDPARVLYLDLGGPDWEAVEVTAAGWQVVARPPVKFRRAGGLLRLPAPARAGTVAELHRFLNVQGDGHLSLVLAWLLAALRSQGPYPVLALHGEQGSAKSTNARVLRGLVDPNSAPLRSEPREARDLMIAASNGWVVAFDNLSHLPGWFSDALCRLSTGGGFSTRELYTDADEVLFDAMRPAVLTGIEELATRGDLAERSLVVHLPAIRDDARRPEADFWAEYDEARPRLLGALLDRAAGALRERPAVRLPSLPRMADFAVWATAGERGQGEPKGDFLKAYTLNANEANELALEASPVAGRVRTLAEAGAWEGTCTDLLGKLAEGVDERTTKSREWPKNARALGGQLRRLGPSLRKAGVLVEHKRAPGGGRTRMVYISRAAPGTAPEPKGEENLRPDGPPASPPAKNGDSLRPLTDGPPSHPGAACVPPGTQGDGRDASSPSLSADDSEVL